MIFDETNKYCFRSDGRLSPYLTEGNRKNEERGRMKGVSGEEEREGGAASCV